MLDISPVSTPGTVLAECPIWHPAEQRLYWTDIFGQAIHRLDPATGTSERLLMPERINSFGFRSTGGLVAGCWTGFGFIDLAAATVEKLWDLPAEQPGFYLNDGRCDRAGRYWAGTVCEAHDRPGAALYRLDRDGSPDRMADGGLTSNGLAFSPDDRTLYYACSVGGIVWAFDFDLADGIVSNRRVFAELHRPDGAAIDSDGCYWIASFGRGEIHRVTPQGHIDRTITLPTTQVTMCAFGGHGLDTLFVTSGTLRLTEEQGRRQPLAGAVFAITGLGTSGLAEPFFRG